MTFSASPSDSWLTLAQASTPAAAAAPAAAPSTQELLGQPAGGAAAPGAPGAPGAPAPAGGMGAGILLLPLALLVFLIVMQMTAGRKEKKKRQELMSGLRRNDRVLTIGGILGTIVEVRDDEIVLRIDESTGTKMTFTKTAIQSVLSSPEARNASTADPKVEVKSAREKAGV
jgi:preprotein translocase subunit YajC